MTTSTIRLHPRAANPLAVRLKREIEGEVLFDAYSRGRYSTDASIYQIEPIGVVIPKTEADAEIALQIAREESVDDATEDLRDLEGMTPELMVALAAGGVHTRDELADLAVDELVEMTAIDEEVAKALIMKAREHWFTT